MRRLKQSFIFAGTGIAKAIKEERSFRIQLLSMVLVVIVGIVLGITILEWVILALCIGGVLSLELINTAIEALVDIKTMAHHPLAEKAKDVAAAAVLLFSMVSAVIGLVIFVPYIWRLLFG